MVVQKTTNLVLCLDVFNDGLDEVVVDVVVVEGFVIDGQQLGLLLAHHHRICVRLMRSGTTVDDGLQRLPEQNFFYSFV